MGQQLPSILRSTSPRCCSLRRVAGAAENAQDDGCRRYDGSLCSQHQLKCLTAVELVDYADLSQGTATKMGEAIPEVVLECLHAIIPIMTGEVVQARLAMNADTGLAVIPAASLDS